LLTRSKTSEIGDCPENPTASEVCRSGNEAKPKQRVSSPTWFWPTMAFQAFRRVFATSVGTRSERPEGRRLFDALREGDTL
jgi:hypothetical protein